MARRPRRGGSTLWRQAVAADMRWIQEHFPTPAGDRRVADVEAGAEVIVSGGRLFRGLRGIDAHLADLFRATGEGERWFRLDTDDTLTELPNGQASH